MFAQQLLGFVVTTSLLLVSVSTGTEVLRPRGVPLSRKSFYDPGKDFQCLDGSATIPFLLVNDDYCDCDDGSDEPGTNACPNGLFHCSNIGFVEKIVPSNRVNDGICDCCDASDEYNSSANCPSNCNELGEQMRVERERYLELLKLGNEVRQRYVEEAKGKLDEAKGTLEDLRSQLAEAEALKNTKEEVKNKAEELEKEALDKHHAEEERLEKLRKEEEPQRQEEENRQQASYFFEELDTDKDGIVTYKDILGYKEANRFDRNKDGHTDEEEAKFYLNAAEQLGLEEFIESAWPLIKPAILVEDNEFNSVPGSDASPPPKADHTQEDQKPDHNEHPEEEAEEDKEEVVAPNEFEAVPTPSQPVKLEYDDHTAKLVDEATKARDEYNDANGKWLDMQTKVRELEVQLETDYGSEGEFMALKGQCFELHDNEYIYKLCPFDSASQRPKAGGTETSLGRWGRWLDTKTHASFKMDGGQQCWNGPVRSVIVNLACGTENQLTRASEPNRCEYAFDFLTPAACVLSSTNNEQYQHTEL